MQKETKFYLLTNFYEKLENVEICWYITG